MHSVGSVYSQTMRCGVLEERERKCKEQQFLSSEIILDSYGTGWLP